MRRAAILALSLLGLGAALLFLGQGGPSEVPTIEQLLEPHDLAEIERIRRLFGNEPEAAVVLLRHAGGAFPRDRLKDVEEALRKVDGVKGTLSSLTRPSLLEVPGTPIATLPASPGPPPPPPPPPGPPCSLPRARPVDPADRAHARAGRDAPLPGPRRRGGHRTGAGPVPGQR